jgi:hypothetical protein
MKYFGLALLAIFVQRLFGMPGLPPWLAEILLPMALIVAVSLKGRERHWPYEALLLGLGWDAVLEPVVGPGGIAWSAAALCLLAVARLVADRSPKSWAGFGAIGAVVVLVVQRLAMLPLGLGISWNLPSMIRTVLFTALWCGAVGTVSSLDLPKHWRAYRVRKLR